MNKLKDKSIYFFVTILLTCGCNKEEFLNKKPSTALVTPRTLEDCEKMLSNYDLINASGILGEVSTDDYYLQTFASWQNQEPTLRNAYIWNQDIFGGSSLPNDWTNLYRTILYCNVVLETLDQIKEDNDPKTWNEIRGAALFIRAFANFSLSQTFCPPYDELSATQDLGLPIRLSADINEIKQRSNLEQTYQHIITDLLQAKDVISAEVKYDAPNRANKPAVFALLAKTYLNMRNYGQALTYSDSCLNLYNNLIDYNVDFLTSDRKNVEVLFQSMLGFGEGILSAFFSPFTIVNSELYNLFEDNDLRKERFFRIEDGLPKRNLSYNGTVEGFTGLATDEVYLISAECLAREGQTALALNRLNKLLLYRYVTGTYEALETEDADELLEWVLIERRKELCFRGIRWQDVRRLNKEGAGIVLKRELNGIVYILEPNSRKYVLPIPPTEIQYSGILQNER